MLMLFIVETIEIIILEYEVHEMDDHGPNKAVADSFIGILELMKGLISTAWVLKYVLSFVIFFKRFEILVTPDKFDVNREHQKRSKCRVMTLCRFMNS